MPQRPKKPAGKPSQKPITAEQSELAFDAHTPSTVPEEMLEPATNGTASEAPGDPQGTVVPPTRQKGDKIQDEQAPLAVSYRNWFLDYASYVILDRAVPHIDD